MPKGVYKRKKIPHGAGAGAIREGSKDYEPLPRVKKYLPEASAHEINLMNEVQGLRRLIDEQARAIKRFEEIIDKLLLH